MLNSSVVLGLRKTMFQNVPALLAWVPARVGGTAALAGMVSLEFSGRYCLKKKKAIKEDILTPTFGSHTCLHKYTIHT